ncbi:sodium-dependent bicarbonate transport family permease [Telluribacter humicola]|uniref:sodium-dependent bicarbonate transport family permease n=1 Tax=Telluribacter humicola TaxID=1720261 RepID=UPI001A95A73D|nr:sodium-dependent bicarbonate transport family permease [Telluribacter humicola]
MQSLLDPVVLFFLLGAFAGMVKSDLRIPQAFYNTLSIYLLLSIGIKGGIELYKNSLSSIALPALGTIALGGIITVIAFLILKHLGKFDKTNAVAIATHYGSVSAVTFAVVLSYLRDRHVGYEEYMTVLLVMLEIPSIAVGIFMAKWSNGPTRMNPKALFHEIFLGKTILLLVGGLLIGVATAYTGNQQLNFFFFDLFKGFLAVFMLEMGVVASKRFPDLKKVGLFLASFGIIMPLLSSLIGIGVAIMTGLSVGGAIALGTMAASASYIAAPAAMKIALPEANATYYLTASLGISFPFNIIFGIPIYYFLAHYLYQVLG